MSKSKGRRSVKLFTKKFEKTHLVGDVEKTGKFRKEKDLFGLFDLIMIDQEGKVTFIQVTTNKNHPHKQYIQFKRQWNINCEQWVYMNRKGWIRYRYFVTGYEKLYLY